MRVEVSRPHQEHYFYYNRTWSPQDSSMLVTKIYLMITFKPLLLISSRNSKNYYIKIICHIWVNSLKPSPYFINQKVFQMLFLVQAGFRKNRLCSCFPSPSKLVLRGAWGKTGTRVPRRLPAKTEQKQQERVCIRPELSYTHQSGESMWTRQKKQTS